MIVREVSAIQYDADVGFHEGVLMLVIEEPLEGTRRLYRLNEQLRAKLHEGTRNPAPQIRPPGDEVAAPDLSWRGDEDPS